MQYGLRRVLFLGNEIREDASQERIHLDPTSLRFFGLRLIEYFNVSGCHELLLGECAVDFSTRLDKLNKLTYLCFYCQWKHSLHRIYLTLHLNLAPDVVQPTIFGPNY